MKFEKYQDGYYLNLFLHKYPTDILEKLAQTTNKHDIIDLLDQLNHPEQVDHEIFFFDEFTFAKREHYDKFKENVTDGFIKLKDLSDFVHYLYNNEIRHYSPYQREEILTLFLEVNTAMKNGYENRYVAVQYEED